MQIILGDNKDSILSNISKIGDVVKNVNVDSIKSHIGTAQKAIDFVADLTKKDPAKVDSILKNIPSSPRPLNKFFED